MPGFAIEPFPEEYPGSHIWFTLRFAAPVSSPPSFSLGEFTWAPNERSEWVASEVLAIGDRLLDGPIVARVEVSGQPCWKIEVGPKATRFVSLASLAGQRVERVIRLDPRRATIEWDGELDDFDVAALERVLASIHARHPLVAVLFQDGSWFDGEPLVDLDDEALVTRLARKPAKQPKHKAKRKAR